LPDWQRTSLLESLDEDEAAALLAWPYQARPAQLAPDGDWRIWLLLGGRGAGKTRAGAEWVAGRVAEDGAARIGLIGATMRDVRAVMVEGESGLLNVADGLCFEPSNNRVLWPGGAVASLLSAEEPDSLRGHQFDCVWGDEFAKWRDPQDALDMALMAMRLGADPRMLLTTTPRNIAPLKVLMAAADVAVTVSRTADNAANLADGFYDFMRTRYGKSALGRQELDGELVEDHDGALWKREWIEKSRVRDAPGLERVVVAVDPPASSTGDECGIVAAGRAGEHGFVLADRSAGSLTPAGWAARVMQAYADFEADAIIAEANQGGEMVRSVLHAADIALPLKLAHATRGKVARAEPVAALYEAGRVRHAGQFPELEDQLCGLMAGGGYEGPGRSPDRADALVWALTELMLGRRREPRVWRF
jgi:phage terminase large subunit-like protein